MAYLDAVRTEGRVMNAALQVSRPGDFSPRAASIQGCVPAPGPQTASGRVIAGFESPAATRASMRRLVRRNEFLQDAQ